MAGLTTTRRKALPKRDFALPEKAPASGSYPIDTPARARSALARAEANASPSDQARIRRAVARRYPAMQLSGQPQKAGKGRSKK